MKMKNTNQYKKSWEGGGNCGHKIFTCWVEEGDILKTISYVELSWIPWKWKIISAMDASMKCKKARMKEAIMPTKYLSVGWRRETFQTQYPIRNCSWLPWKWKLITAMNASMKCKNTGMEEGVMPIKSLWARWRRESFQTQYPMWNCWWLPWKW